MDRAVQEIIALLMRDGVRNHFRTVYLNGFPMWGTLGAPGAHARGENIPHKTGPLGNAFARCLKQPAGA